MDEGSGVLRWLARLGGSLGWVARSVVDYVILY